MTELEAFRQRSHTHGRGQEAERVAVHWLEANGYRIRSRNVRTRAGEIDLVACEGDTLCFLEVKARDGTLCGPAIEAVTPHKQRRLGRAAALYLLEHPWHGACRFDVLGLDAGTDGAWTFTLVRDAFWV